MSALCKNCLINSLEILSGHSSHWFAHNAYRWKLLVLKKKHKRSLERKLRQNQEWVSIKEHTEKYNKAPTAASLDLQVGNQLSQSSWRLWGTMWVGLSRSRVLRPEIKRSHLQWSWEAYDQGCTFPNTYCHKILFVCPIFTNIPSLESFVRSGWSPGIKLAAATSCGMRDGQVDASFFCSRSYMWEGKSG